MKKAVRKCARIVTSQSIACARDGFFGHVHQVGADLALPLVVHRAGGLDEGVALGRGELRDGDAQGGDLLEQRLAGLDQALAGDGDLLLARLDGGLAHGLAVGGRPAFHTSLLTTKTSGSAT
jgi:hypothetical protein